MKINKMALAFISLLILLLTVSSVSAIDDNNETLYFTDEEFNNNINEIPMDNIENNDDICDNILSSPNDDELLGEGNIIIVDEYDGEYNEMTQSSIQNAINSAKDGDTIVINGKCYHHSHIIVDKKLTIVSYVNTILTPCFSKATSNNQGIFYISPKASGTIIEGFTLMDNSMYSDNEGYGILVRGASDVIIRNCSVTTDDIADSIRLENTKNCLIENVSVFNSINGIKIINSQNAKVRNSVIENNPYGINILGSTNTHISYSNVSANNVGIEVGEGSSYTTIIYNNITGNKHSAVSLSSSDNVNVLSNYIADNGFGVYVNCNIVKIAINGNFFNLNRLYAVYNDYRTLNLAGPGGEKLEQVNNNYMIGHNERPVYNNLYKFVGKNKGVYDYDSANDVYIKVGYGKGSYEEIKDAAFLGYVFAINEYVYCPSIYFTYGKKSWFDGNYFLSLSEITQVKKGVYAISIVDADGNIAKDLSSVYVYFYLNKNSTAITPQSGDVYKKVLMQNGTATVRFNPEDFKENGNVLLASFPGIEKNIYENPYKELSIPDEQIPGVMSNTSITISNLNTYPKSGQYLIATLRDENGNPLVGKTIFYDIVSKTYTTKTDSNGQARLPINLNEGTYPATVRFVENDEYYASSAKATVYVKKEATQIISSNINMVPNVAEYFKFTLKDASGKAIPNQKVVVTVNGKSYALKTDSKGQAGLSLKFSIQKIYKLTIKFSGTNKYKASTKVNRLSVAYSSKVAKMDVAKVTIPPKTYRVYSVFLRDASGKGIANQNVVININGNSYKRITEANGRAAIKISFNDLKSYKISASYSGNKIYKNAYGSNYIVVAKTKSVFSASDMVLTPKTQKTYTVTLKTGSGLALSNQKVIFTLNGKNYEKITNSKGQASISVNLGTEKDYPVVLTYKGTDIYAGAKLTKHIKIQKIAASITSSNQVFSKDSNPSFEITLKDASGNPLSNQKVTFTFNGQNQVKTTDAKGLAKVEIPSNNPATISIISKFAGTDKYKAVSKTNTITILNKTNTVFINPGLSSTDILKVLDGCSEGNDVEFLGTSYSGVALNINKALNIYSNVGTVLNGKSGSPVLRILSSGVNVSKLSIVSNEDIGIFINGADNVNVFDNTISNKLDQSKKDKYVESTLSLPGYGISVDNSKNVDIFNNNISSFESGIFVEDSSNLDISNNHLFENNYGIKYGYAVSNTNIDSNKIVNSIGLYTMEVPEGPRGYGIFFNNSAVDVTVTNNIIDWNHLGISVDAANSTGIVIKSNHISDNVLEGIRFNAGYDLAENAVEPIVTNNAIYRNARGPSMMILGELSANPEGIYGPGQWNDSLKLKLDPNWYGKNVIVTWDNDTGVVGWGTMCPRISTTPIAFNSIECLDSGYYSITFYNDGKIASELPVFDLFARLNNNAEVNFNVINGVGSFNFNLSDYSDSNNVIEISVGSSNDLHRYYAAFYSQNVTVPLI